MKITKNVIGMVMQSICRRGRLVLDTQERAEEDLGAQRLGVLVDLVVTMAYIVTKALEGRLLSFPVVSLQSWPR